MAKEKVNTDTLGIVEEDLEHAKSFLNSWTIRHGNKIKEEQKNKLKRFVDELQDMDNELTDLIGEIEDENDLLP